MTAATMSPYTKPRTARLAARAATSHRRLTCGCQAAIRLRGSYLLIEVLKIFETGGLASERL